MLTDFGLARAADDVSMTRWGIIAGTPEYMSPEQARGEALDGRSDLFSLGCVMYEMATGVSPFRADSTMATLRRIVDEKPAAMASLAPELPPWFIGIVERLLSKDPAQRFASASEVSQLLEQCLSHLQQPTSVPLPTSLAANGNRQRLIITAPQKGVIAMFGILGVAILGMVLWQAATAPDSNDSQINNSQANEASANKGAKEKAIDKRLGTVLGKPLYEGDLNKVVSVEDNLRQIILRPLIENYCQRHRLDRSEELKTKIKDEKTRHVAGYFVCNAELNRHVYEKHGGRVILSAFGPIAFDAMDKWLTEREKAGELEITDLPLKTKLDELMSQEKPGTRFASPDQIKSAFDPAITDRYIENLAKIPAGAYRDPAIKIIGVVLERPLYIHDRNSSDPSQLPGLLYALVVPELEELYRKQHPDVVPTEDEIDWLAVKMKERAIRSLTEQRNALKLTLEAAQKKDPPSKGDPNTVPAIKQVDDTMKRVQEGDGRTQATALARTLKLQKHLFDHYGGGRILQGNQGLILLDAQKKWVEEREGLGEFQIANPELRQKLYEYWSTGAHHRSARLTDAKEFEAILKLNLKRTSQ